MAKDVLPLVEGDGLNGSLQAGHRGGVIGSSQRKRRLAVRSQIGAFSHGQQGVVRQQRKPQPMGSAGEAVRRGPA